MTKSLSERRGSITDSQRRYLANLAHKAFSHLCQSLVDVNHLETLSMREASDSIGALKELEAANWPTEWRYLWSAKKWLKPGDKDYDIAARSAR